MARNPSPTPQSCLELFDDLVASAIASAADAATRPDSLWEGYRLLAVDGTPWGHDRTPVFIAQLPGPARHRLRVASARLRVGMATELFTHSPIEVVVQLYQEKETSVSARLWSKIPDRSVIVGDESFGTAPNVYDAVRAMCLRDVHVLTAVGNAVKSRPIEHLPDGSAWVEFPIRDVPRAVEPLRVREIRATGRAVNGRRFQLRLWTTLGDPQRFSAEVLARSFIERWGELLARRELKLDVRATPARSSYTMETSLQELAAAVLASVILARARRDALEKGERAPSWMSYPQILHATEKLWAAFELLGDSLTDPQRHRMAERYEDIVRRAIGRPERGSPVASPGPGRLSAPSRRGPDGRPRVKSAQVIVQKV